MELEGIERVGGDLIARRSAQVEDFPLILYADTVDGERIVGFDDRLPAAVCDQLSSIRRLPFDTQTAARVLEGAGFDTIIRQFRTYVFPHALDFRSAADVNCFRSGDPKVVLFGFSGFADKVFGIQRNGRIVSACVSSRQNSKAGEAWVLTQPEYRRKGLAQQVVSAWAGSLREDAIIPFYSHEIENTKSELLARKLNLAHVYDETVIERSTQQTA